MSKTVVRLEDVPLHSRDLSGKTIVFTGGTDGMGRVAIEDLARMGASIVLLGRNPQKTHGVCAEVNTSVGVERVRGIVCDLASQASVRAAADEVLRSTPTIDVLVNCAGANFAERRMTEDGVERGWAVNHLGGLLLTHLLLDRLKASAPSRVVHLSSATERLGHIHLDDIHLERSWAPLRSYAQAKLALNMGTRSLARELAGSGVTVNALNPGWIKTANVGSGGSLKGWRKWVGALSTALFGEPPKAGADRIVTAAIAPQYAELSGAFIYEDHVRDPNKEALDDTLVEKVWELSRSQLGLTPAEAR